MELEALRAGGYEPVTGVYGIRWKQGLVKVNEDPRQHLKVDGVDGDRRSWRWLVRHHK